jgi:hypothetical protein
MDTTKRNPLLPLVGAALVVAVTALSAPAAAETHVRAHVVFHPGGYDVIPPAGFQCTATERVPGGPSGGLAENTHDVRLECSSDVLDGIIPFCGTVTAGVTGQTGGAGATVAVAICGSTAQAACRGTYDPVTGAHDCAISVTGEGVAACEFVTVGVGYTTDSWCDFPIL